jgi:hypothetical protein
MHICIQTGILNKSFTYMQVNKESWKNYFFLRKEKLHGKQKYSSMHLHTPAVLSSAGV